MGVNDESEHAFLGAEKRWIAAAVRAGVPYFGVCLGRSCLPPASVRTCGQESGRRSACSRWNLRRRDVRTPCSGPRRRLPALQWHADTFDLPKGAVHLAARRTSTRPSELVRPPMASSSTSRRPRRCSRSGRGDPRRLALRYPRPRRFRPAGGAVRSQSAGDGSCRQARRTLLDATGDREAGEASTST